MSITQVARTIEASDGKIYTFSLGRKGEVYNGNKGKMLVTIDTPIDKTNHATQLSCLAVSCEFPRAEAWGKHSSSDEIGGIHLNMLCPYCQAKYKKIQKAWKLTEEGKPVSKLDQAKARIARDEARLVASRVKLNKELARAEERSREATRKIEAADNMKAWVSKHQ